MSVRPNCALDPPPEHVTVDGADYKIETDYRAWLRICEKLRAAGRGEPGALFEALALAFGGIPVDEDPEALIEALTGFMKGYPGPPLPEGDGDGPSLEWDINEIIVAIRDQHRVDLSHHRGAPFHWWDFLLLVRTLTGNHAALLLAQARSYRGDDPALVRLREACRLPAREGPEQKETIDAINRAFYNA